MAGLRLNNRQRPADIDGIDDREIKRLMKDWAQDWTRLETDLKGVFSRLAAYQQKNRELNHAATRKANERGISPEAKRALDDLVARTAAVHDAVENVIGS